MLEETPAGRAENLVGEVLAPREMLYWYTRLFDSSLTL